MNETLPQVLTDPVAHAIENALCESLRLSLQAGAQKDVLAQGLGPRTLEFKELKAALSGEVVLTTASVGAGGAKLILCFDRDTESVLLSGIDGSQTEHARGEAGLEAIRGLLNEVVGNTVGALAGATDQAASLESLRCVLLEMTPADLPAVGAVVGECRLEMGATASIWYVASKDLLNLFGAGATRGPVQTEEVVDAAASSNAVEEISLVLDIELDVTIELGRTHMLIRDIVKLGPGSVVELDKLSGEPVDLFVNGRKFARGEVVVVDENFAVRITELSSPADRLAASRN